MSLNLSIILPQICWNSICGSIYGSLIYGIKAAIFRKAFKQKSFLKYVSTGFMISTIHGLITLL